MDILDFFLDILLKPPQPLWGYFSKKELGHKGIKVPACQL